jgi:hypothetical protein
MRASTAMGRRAAVFGLLLATAGSALAQTSPPPTEPPGKREWQFQITPYLWIAGIHGDVGVVPRVPPVDVDVTFSDLFDNLNIGVMLAGEARRDKLGIIMDLNYLSLTDDKATPGPLFGSAKMNNDTFFGDLALLYRVFENDRLFLDVGGGGRLWHIYNKVELSPGVLQGRTDDGSQTWADPVIYARGDVKLGAGFSLTALGDIGGFSVSSRLTWQATGLLNYNFNDSIAATAGYRYLSVDYKNDGFVWDVSIKGPIIGLKILF